MRPIAAATATSCGRSQRFAGKITRPAVMSSPAGRTLAPRFKPGRQQRPARVVQTDVLLHEHRVRALGHRRAGEDANGFVGRDGRPRGGTARLQPTRNAEGSCFTARQVLPAHGIAVDRRVRERRQLQRGDQIVGQHATIGFGERHGLHFVDGAETRNDCGDRILDGQDLRAGREAVLRELCHG